MKYFWELIQHDGTRIEVLPTDVEVIKRRWENGQPIHTSNSGSIPANQIKAFRPTNRRYNERPLLEDVSRAFNEPLITDDGIQSRWVKKPVTQAQWDKFYSPSGYKHLNNEEGMVMVAFRLPVHQIDVNKVEYCSEEDMQRLQHQKY